LTCRNGFAKLNHFRMFLLILSYLIISIFGCELDPTNNDRDTLKYCNATKFSILVMDCVCTSCDEPYKAAGGLADRFCYHIDHCTDMEYCGDCGTPWNWTCEQCEPGWNVEDLYKCVNGTKTNDVEQAKAYKQRLLHGKAAPF